MNETDFSKAIEQVQEMLSNADGQNRLQSIIGALTGNAGAEDAAVSPENADRCENTALPCASPSLEDAEMLFKMKNIMSAMSASKMSTQANFLNALKPLLGSERQRSVEKAIKLISLSSALKAIKEAEKGGG